MEGKPKRRAGSCGSSGRADPCLVKIPLLGFAPDELKRTRGIVKGRFDRRFGVGLSEVLGDEPVIDGSDGDAGLKQRICIGESVKAFLGAASPTAAVDDEGERSGLVGICLPEVEDVTFMIAVSNLRMSRLGNRGSIPRRFLCHDRLREDRNADQRYTSNLLHGRNAL